MSSQTLSATSLDQASGQFPAPSGIFHATLSILHEPLPPIWGLCPVPCRSLSGLHACTLCYVKRLEDFAAIEAQVFMAI